MIRDQLIPELQKVFARREFIVNPAGNPIIRFPGIQAEVGDVTIHDDGNEATIFVEHISHRHVRAYNDTLSIEQRDNIITEDEIEFLQELFSDRILLFTTPGNRIGGWMNLDEIDGPVPIIGERSYFLWSKPYKTNKSEQIAAADRL